MSELVKYICFATLMFLMSCAISRNENERVDNLINDEQLSSKAELTDSLTSEVLSRYETRAIQKLEDFYDYLNLLCSEQYDVDVKLEIRKMAAALFYDDQVLINPFHLSEQVNSLPVIDYLDLHSNESASSDLVINEVEVQEHLSKKSKDVFVGRMIFRLRYSSDLSASEKRKYADFSMRRITKVINTEKSEIWEVYLDKVY